MVASSAWPRWKRKAVKPGMAITEKVIGEPVGQHCMAGCDGKAKGEMRQKRASQSRNDGRFLFRTINQLDFSNSIYYFIMITQNEEIYG